MKMIETKLQQIQRSAKVDERLKQKILWLGLYHNEVCKRLKEKWSPAVQFEILESKLRI